MLRGYENKTIDIKIDLKLFDLLIAGSWRPVVGPHPAEEILQREGGRPCCQGCCLCLAVPTQQR